MLADPSKESILIVETSGDVELLRRISRSDFRVFIESSMRMLDKEDRDDQAEIQHIGNGGAH